MAENLIHSARMNIIENDGYLVIQILNEAGDILFESSNLDAGDISFHQAPPIPPIAGVPTLGYFQKTRGVLPPISYPVQIPSGLQGSRVVGYQGDVNWVEPNPDGMAVYALPLTGFSEGVEVRTGDGVLFQVRRPLTLDPNGAFAYYLVFGTITDVRADDVLVLANSMFSYVSVGDLLWYGPDGEELGYTARFISLTSTEYEGLADRDARALYFAKDENTGALELFVGDVKVTDQSKMDKVVTDEFAAVTFKDGAQTLTILDEDATPETLPVRNDGGTFDVGVPTADANPTTKLYVDTGLDALEDYVDAQIDIIEEVMPADASATNKLTSETFVQTAITQAAGRRIYSGGTSFATYTSLLADLAMDNITDANGNPLTPMAGDLATVELDDNTASPNEGGSSRYRLDGVPLVPKFDASLSSNPMTPQQQAAIDSGITSTLVTKLNGIQAGAQVNVQADWTASTPATGAILNKPGNATTSANGLMTTTQVSDLATAKSDAAGWKANGAITDAMIGNRTFPSPGSTFDPSLLLADTYTGPLATVILVVQSWLGFLYSKFNKDTGHTHAAGDGASSQGGELAPFTSTRNGAVPKPTPGTSTKSVLRASGAWSEIDGLITRRWFSIPLSAWTHDAVKNEWTTPLSMQHFPLSEADIFMIASNDPEWARLKVKARPNPEAFPYPEITLYTTLEPENEIGQYLITRLSAPIN